MRLYPRDRIRIASYEFTYEEDPPPPIHTTRLEDTKHEILSTVDISSDSSQARTNHAGDGKLHTILAIIEELSSALELDRVLPRIIDSLLRIFVHARIGLVLSREGAAGDFVPAVVRCRGDKDGPVRISKTLANHVAKLRAAVLIADTMTDARFDASSSIHEMELRSIMCVPLIDRGGSVLGMIQLEARGGSERFCQEDLEVLAGVARHLAMVIENSRLHEEAMKAQRHELERRFQGIIEGAIQGILIHRQYKPLFVNKAWAALHGYAVEEVMEMPTVLPLIAPEEREHAVGHEEAQLRGEDIPARYEGRGLTKDGTTIWLEKFTTVVDWDDGPAVQTAVIDVSDRKRAEEALRNARDELEKRVIGRTAALGEANRLLEAEIEDRQKKEERLRESESLYHSLVDHIPLCVARKDLQGTFTFVNPAMADMLGREPNELVGLTDYDLFEKERADKYRQDDEQVARSGRLLELDETVPLRDGSVAYIHTLKTPTYDAEGRIIGTQLAFWDFTQQKQAETERNRYAAELERSNRELEQFAYSVSHDLQSPLRTVASYCQLLQKQYQDALDDEAHEFLSGAVDGARRMKRLLDDLLSYSRVTTQAAQFLPADATAVLKEALNNLQAAIDENEAELSHDELPRVVCDATQLMQLFQNLIGNAIRYRRQEPPRIHIGVEEQPSAWKFSVRDNGVGIEPRHQDRIFQVFQRLYAEHEIPGSGVGLSICKRIVERLGGRIWVESEPGHGSVFHFTLPKVSRGLDFAGVGIP